MTTLPGWSPNPLRSKLYSGYLHMGTQHFHYVYAEAINVDPATAPVALWLNGGVESERQSALRDVWIGGSSPMGGPF